MSTRPKDCMEFISTQQQVHQFNLLQHMWRALKFIKLPLNVRHKCWEGLMCCLDIIENAPLGHALGGLMAALRGSFAWKCGFPAAQLTFIVLLAKSLVSSL